MSFMDRGCWGLPVHSLVRTYSMWFKSITICIWYMSMISLLSINIMFLYLRYEYRFRHNSLSFTIYSFSITIFLSPFIEGRFKVPKLIKYLLPSEHDWEIVHWVGFEYWKKLAYSSSKLHKYKQIGHIWYFIISIHTSL